MDKTKQKEVERRIKSLFPHADVTYGTVRIEHEVVNFGTLMKLSRALGTMQFTVAGYHLSDGCETCGHGAENGVEIEYDISDCDISLPYDSDTEDETLTQCAERLSKRVAVARRGSRDGL